MGLTARALGRAGRRRRPSAPGGALLDPAAVAATALRPADPAAVARALRTAAVAGFAPGWVGPHWLERQHDPSSPAFVPLGDLPLVANVTRRNWTALGNPASPSGSVVDERGLVTPWPDGWSLDWWVGAEDRWHLPSTEVAVRQRLLDGVPVVETAMRVPGGDIVHRAFGAKVPVAGSEADDVVVVEVENATSTPVAVALVVRPANPQGLAGVGHVELDRHRTVLVDGRPALLLPRAPAGAAWATLPDGDLAGTVTSGGAGPGLPGSVRCPDGLATAAFVFPLAHTAVLRVALPLAPPPARRRASRRGRGLPSADTALTALPAGDQVARGWKVHTGRGLRLVLPDERLAAAVEANRCYLLLHRQRADGEDAPGPSVPSAWTSHVAAVVGALDRYGAHEAAAAVLATYPRRQQADGTFPGGPAGEAEGAALHAMAEHWRLTRDRGALADTADLVAGAARAIERARRAGGADPAASWWGAGGLRDGAELLRVLGEERGAADVDAMAQACSAELEAVAAGAPADRPVAATLAACWPLRLLPADDPRVAATADAVRRGAGGAGDVGDAVVGGPGRGLAPSATVQLALVELLAGDRRALARLRWLLDAGTATWTWPGAVHPRLGGGCAGDGHDGRTAADLLTFVRNLLVREAPGGLALCSLLPEGWEGQSVEVLGAPTAAGRLSYALRWHGERPAILWELDAHPGAGPVTLTAPGLDAGWSSVEPAGEALLSPYVPPGSEPRRPVEEVTEQPPDAGTFG